MRLPISSGMPGESSTLQVNSSTHDASRAGLGQLDVHADPVALSAHGAARDVVDIEQTRGFFRRDVARAERVDAAARDDEEHAQTRETSDEVFGEAVREAASLRRVGCAVDEGHHADRGATRG